MSPWHCLDLYTKLYRRPKQEAVTDERVYKHLPLATVARAASGPEPQLPSGQAVESRALWFRRFYSFRDEAWSRARDSPPNKFTQLKALSVQLKTHWLKLLINTASLLKLLRVLYYPSFQNSPHFSNLISLTSKIKYTPNDSLFNIMLIF